MYRVRKVTIAESQVSSDAVKKVMDYFGKDRIEVVPDLEVSHDYQEGKQSLHLGEKRGEALVPCASLSREYICCGVQVLKSVSNCPFQCSYCVLQDYLTNETMQVVADFKGLMEEVRRKLRLQPWRFFRIGTWVLGDSLAWDPLTGTSSELVREFAKLPNAMLELKTKSNLVETLLELPHEGKTAVAWSLNPSCIIEKEEKQTATLDRRIEAMEKVVRAGYLLALHFDPMIYFEGWEQAYSLLVREVFSRVPTDRIAWVSMGSLRFNPDMKPLIEARFPESELTAAEMILGGDGKLRYVKPLRRKLYAHLWGELQNHYPRDRAKQPFTYLCMERKDLWEKVFGDSMPSIQEHDFRMTESLYRRFPGLVGNPPKREHYAAIQY